MSQPRALYIGGCNAPYHRIEPTIEPIKSALTAVGLAVDVSGIYHPTDGDETTGDYTAINAENLAKYDAVVLFTTGFGNGEDIDALLDYVESGRPLIGVHCAGDSFTDSAKFVAALGGRFRHHPAPLDIAVDIVDSGHPVTQGVGSFTVMDELYMFQDYDRSRVHLLAQTSSATDPEIPGPVPVAWVRQHGAGRIFYLSLGHFPEVMADPNWRRLFQQGTKWALGW